MNCASCGSWIAPTAMFCGECGTSALTATATSDTQKLERLPKRDVATHPVNSLDDSAHGEPWPSAWPLAPVEEEPDWRSHPPRHAAHASATPDTVAEQELPATLSTPVPETVRADVVPVASETAATQFTLELSVGEPVLVSAHGFLGRNPQRTSDSSVLVRVPDTQLTVSKTHLEFGIHGDDFWIGDLHSGNGTAMKAPSGKLIEAVPGQRYIVPRGTRVYIGEQYFDVV